MSEIARRYGADLPDLHRVLHQAGCFDPHHAAHLQFSDLLWLDPDEILTWRFHPDQIGGLLPFARTGNEDLWCLRLDATREGRAPVAFCPDEDEVAVFYAPDFTAFLYRALLEEYACTGLTERQDLPQSRETLAGYVDLLAPHLPGSWTERLRGLQALPWNTDRNDYSGAIDAAELDEILAADLAWDRLDEEFEHYR